MRYDDQARDLQNHSGTEIVCTLLSKILLQSVSCYGVACVYAINSRPYVWRCYRHYYIISIMSACTHQCTTSFLRTDMQRVLRGLLKYRLEFCLASNSFRHYAHLNWRAGGGGAVCWHQRQHVNWRGSEMESFATRALAVSGGRTVLLTDELWAWIHVLCQTSHKAGML